MYFGSELIAVENARYPIKIDSLDQLIEYENIKIFVNEHSAQHSALLNYYANFHTRLKFVGYDEMYSRNFIMKIIKNNMVMISSGHDVENIMQQFRFFNLHQSEDKNPSMYMVSFVIRKNYDKNIKIKFGELLKLIDQHGITDHENMLLGNYHRMLKNFNMMKRITSGNFDEFISIDRFELNIQQLKFIFLQYDLGIIISSISLIVEIVNKNFFK